MRAIKLQTEPFEFISYLKLECTKEMNEHGVLRMTGLIKEEKNKEYMEMVTRETWVRVYAISEDERIRNFFAGVLTGLWIKKEGQVHTLSIEVKTGSFLLDIGQHMRSFQGGNLPYSQAAGLCIESEGGELAVREKGEREADRLLVQYRETDWAFTRRLASYAGVVLIPEDRMPKKGVSWGCPGGESVREIQADSYYIEQDYEKYKKQAAEGNGQQILADMLRFVVCSREMYVLGESVWFEGKKLIIGKIDSWLEGQELYHRYYLMTKRGILMSPYDNQCLSGISLNAAVAAVERAMVKVIIEEDENKENCGSRWFDYATVYSTPDGTGWYCMPEVGDKVRLVFPDRMEEHAYVSSSVHLGAAGGRTNPNEKSWKNPQNKEILFTPDGIILNNHKGMSVEISDKDGIKIISSSDIAMQAKGNISVKSQSGGVNLSADESILMQQGAAKVQISDAINICGGKVYMN